MSKLKLLTASIGLAFAASAVAAPVELYIEQNVASNAADDGTYTTEAGATIEPLKMVMCISVLMTKAG